MAISITGRRQPIMTGGGYEVTECLIAPEWQHIFEHKVKTIIEVVTKG